MGHIISIANQKGGVGKTTTALNLSSAFSLKGQKTLLVDMDPQGSASSGLGISAKIGVYEALMGQKTLKEVLCSTAEAEAEAKTKAQTKAQAKAKAEAQAEVFLKIAPSSMNLAGAEMELAGQEDRVFFLKKILKEIKNDYHFILIDTPPSLGLLTLNALSASDTFIVPLQCEYYALEGLSRLLETAREVKERWNPSLKLHGILLTLFDARNSLSYQVEKEVRRHFGEQVFETLIPRNVRLSEAPGFGKSIFQYDRHCLGAMAYEHLAREVSAYRPQPQKYPLSSPVEGVSLV